MEIVDCPTCGAPTEVQAWRTLSSTHGPLEFVKTLCVRRHGYLMPREMLTGSG